MRNSRPPTALKWNDNRGWHFPPPSMQDECFIVMFPRKQKFRVKGCHKTIHIAIFHQLTKDSLVLRLFDGYMVTSPHCHRCAWGQILRVWIEDSFLSVWVRERCGQTQTRTETPTARNHFSTIRSCNARAACTSSREESSTEGLVRRCPGTAHFQKFSCLGQNNCVRTAHGISWGLLNWETGFQSCRAQNLRVFSAAL